MSFETEGFLSEDLAHRFSKIAECEGWFDLALRLNRLGHKIAFAEREFEIQSHGLSDVRVLTIMLFFRVLSNFQGSIVLADRGLIVEARALARCVGETVLCMVGAKLDPEHWKALVDGEIKSRKGRT